MKREEILRQMEEVMGKAPKLLKVPPVVEVIEEKEEAGLLRRRIRYEAEERDWVTAWLLLPPGKSAVKRAGVLCLHQTTRIGKDEPAGLGGKPNLHYGRELALRGHVVLAPDYPNFGDYTIDVYKKGYASATMKGIVNHRRGLDVLAHTKGVDAKRLAAVGHSLGGHNALFVGAWDERVTAVVTSCGFTSFARYMKGDLTGWSHAGYMPRIAEKYGKDPKKMPFEFRDVLAAMGERRVFVNAPKGDTNFDWVGVDEAVKESGIQHVEVLHPEGGHDFAPEERMKAWAWLESGWGK